MLGFSINTSLKALGLTSFSAELKSSSVTVNFCKTSSGISAFSSNLISGSVLLKTFIAASLHNAAISAPTKPCVISASLIKLTSFANGIFLECIFKIFSLPCLFGTPITTSLSNLPGLLNAGSMALGLLVAPITITLPRDFNPSSIVSNWLTALLSNSP